MLLLAGELVLSCIPYKGKGWSICIDVPLLCATLGRASRSLAYQQIDTPCSAPPILGKNRTTVQIYSFPLIFCRAVTPTGSQIIQTMKKMGPIGFTGLDIHARQALPDALKTRQGPQQWEIHRRDKHLGLAAQRHTESPTVCGNGLRCTLSPHASVTR